MIDGEKKIERNVGEMSHSLAVHEEVSHNCPPFRLLEIRTPDHRKSYFVENPHWHEDLEIFYTVSGENKHYINGQCCVAHPGRVIVTNCEFVHHIEPDPELDHVDQLTGLLIMVDRRFLDNNFEGYRTIFFTNEKEQASDEVISCIEKIHAFMGRERPGAYDYLYERSLILELLYLLCGEGVVERKNASAAGTMKENEKIRQILAYVADHYGESLTQSSAAEYFHFTPTYFSRYFKKCTGKTFVEYLTDYRLEVACQALMQHSGQSVNQIAMDCGFSDVRRLIVTFKEKFGMTPLQYRKANL